jgi:hypothetical protein
MENGVIKLKMLRNQLKIGINSSSRRNDRRQKNNQCPIISNNCLDPMLKIVEEDNCGIDDYTEQGHSETFSGVKFL